MKLTEEELACEVVDKMDLSEVCQFAAEGLADFYVKNPEDFREALAIHEKDGG